MAPSPAVAQERHHHIEVGTWAMPTWEFFVGWRLCVCQVAGECTPTVQLTQPDSDGDQHATAEFDLLELESFIATATAALDALRGAIYSAATAATTGDTHA